MKSRTKSADSGRCALDGSKNDPRECENPFLFDKTLWVLARQFTGVPSLGRGSVVAAQQQREKIAGQPKTSEASSVVRNCLLFLGGCSRRCWLAKRGRKGLKGGVCRKKRTTTGGLACGRLPLALTRILVAGTDGVGTWKRIKSFVSPILQVGENLSEEGSPALTESVCDGA